MKSRAVLFDDLVTREARALAREILEKKLSESDLPLPKDSSLEIHLDQLILADPSILISAKKRVEAKADAHSESLRAIGIELEIIHPIEIDLSI
jgi:hypothetical protein